MKQQAPRKLYTVAEAAQVLEISRSKLYRLIQTGQVPYCVMASGARRMTQADVDTTRSWLDQPVFVHRPAAA